MEHDRTTIAALASVTTATLTTLLLKKGLRNVWMRGTRPVRPGGQARVVGRAFTLRFIPAREDQATPESWAKPTSTRGAIEAMPAGCVAVVDARGVTDAGIFGDILCARMRKRGVAALSPTASSAMFTACSQRSCRCGAQGAAAPPSVAGLTFVNWQEPIGCGGVAVFPDDVVVADDDGAVVIPAALVDETIALALEQEQLEAWIMQEIARGVPLAGAVPAERGDEGAIRRRARPAGARSLDRDLRAAAARDTAADRRALMKRRKLGSTGFEVAPLAFGGNVFGWTVDEPTSFACSTRSSTRAST